MLIPNIFLNHLPPVDPLLRPGEERHEEGYDGAQQSPGQHVRGVVLVVWDPGEGAVPGIGQQYYLPANLIT